MRTILVVVLAIAYWQVAAFVVGGEPWDFGAYNGFYLIALALCALLGYRYSHQAWRWGIIVIFAQLPSVLLLSKDNSMLLAGLFFLVLLSLPAIAAASGASYLKRSHRSS